MSLAAKQEVEAILIAGDVFDEYSDLEEARLSFVKIIEEYDIPVYAIAGNHEYLRKPTKATLSSYSLGSVNWFHDLPFSVLNTNFENWELAVIPYAMEYKEYRTWKIPSKKKTRILMAHGLIPEALVYTGPSEEEGSHLLEMSMLEIFQPDYIALGHIHKKSNFTLNQYNLYYPGSPRVWRKGETGERSVNIIHINPTGIVKVEPHVLKEAGVYIEYSMNILPDGSIPSIESIQGAIGKNDRVYIELSGLADQESIVQSNIKELKNSLSLKCRKLEISDENLKYFDGISNQVLVTNFLKHWDGLFLNAKSQEEKDILMEARQIGLESIISKI